MPLAREVGDTAVMTRPEYRQIPVCKLQRRVAAIDHDVCSDNEACLV